MHKKTICVDLCKIKNEYSYAIIEKCSESDCSLRIDNEIEDKIVILKGEKIVQSYRICDCLIFIIKEETLIIAIVELKRKSINVSVIREKFENTIDLLNDIVNNLNLRRPKKFFPILLYEDMRGSEFVMLKNLKLHFACKTHSLIIENCGTNLLKIMGKYF